MKTIFSILWLAGSIVAHADVRTLVNSRTRPTIEDIEQQAPASKFPQNPFMGSQTKRTTDFADETARVIAELEFAYPGAVYVPLGRDVVALGDSIDAFYRAHGQFGRVLRLNASGPTTADASDENIVKFIKGAGIDIPNLASSRGYIVFDRTNYTSSSQSTRILRAVYDEYVRLGGKREDLVTKFAVFNMFHSGSSVSVGPRMDRNRFFAERKLELQNGSPLPMKVLATVIEPARGVMTYTPEWHGSFGNLLNQSDGTMKAALPPINPEPTRQQILFDMRFMMETVAKPQFLAGVQTYAMRLGYQFELPSHGGACNMAYH